MQLQSCTHICSILSTFNLNQFFYILHYSFELNHYLNLFLFYASVSRPSALLLLLLLLLLFANHFMQNNIDIDRQFIHNSDHFCFEHTQQRNI